MLVIDRPSRQLELFRLARGTLRKVQQSPDSIRSRVIPCTFERTSPRRAPAIRVINTKTGDEWII